MDRLSGVIKSYDWGRGDALAELLGHPAPGHPEAEYWLGTHPAGPARLESTGEPLDRAVAERPYDLLGADLAAGSGQLPFLVKLLAADRALSIQTHPNAAQAAAGFAREEAAGVRRDAPERLYRDPNHKPELICALTPFEARCGFRAPEETAAVLEGFGPALDPVRHRLVEVGPAETAVWLLGLEPERAGALARATLAAAAESNSSRPDREAASTVTIGHDFPDDIGIVVALLLNHVLLAPGQALFLSAGTLHAYLDGVGVEVMASSDNVIRGGLTSKHIDVAELVAIVDREAGPPPLQTPASNVHTYESPVPDFAVTRLGGGDGPIGPLDFEPTGPEIVLVTEGEVELVSGSATLAVSGGQAAFVTPADGPYRLVDRREGRTMAWRVTAGLRG